MCCFSGFLLVGLDVGTVSNLKINYVQMEATLHCCFSVGGGGMQTTQVKKAIAKARHSTHIYRTTHKALYKRYLKE